MWNKITNKRFIYLNLIKNQYSVKYSFNKFYAMLIEYCSGYSIVRNWVLRVFHPKYNTFKVPSNFKETILLVCSLKFMHQI